MLESDPAAVRRSRRPKLRALPWVLLALAILLIGAAIWLSRRQPAHGDRARGLDDHRGGGRGRRPAARSGPSCSSGSSAAAPRRRGSIWEAFFGDLRPRCCCSPPAARWSPPPARRCCGRSTSARRSSAAPGAARRDGSREPRGRGPCAAPAAGRVGVLIVVEHEFVIDLVAILVGLYLAYAGAAELMRLTIPARARRARSATAVAGGRWSRRSSAPVLILAAGLIFIRVGGAEEDPPRSRRRLQRLRGALRRDRRRGHLPGDAQLDVGGDEPGLALRPAGGRASPTSCATGSGAC